MAIGTGKKIVLVVIVVLGYLIGNHANDDKRYEELKSKEPSSLSEDDKSFIKTVDDERMKAEAERRGYQKKWKQRRKGKNQNP